MIDTVVTFLAIVFVSVRASKIQVCTSPCCIILQKWKSKEFVMFLLL
jgi:hypothetical protein